MTPERKLGHFYRRLIFGSGVMQRTRERDTQNAICEYLAYKGVLFWRQNNVPVFDGRYRALPKYSMRGIPDIIVVKEGRFIGIEVKSDRGKLSPEQAEFARLCVKNGGEYVVARSLEDVQRVGL